MTRALRIATTALVCAGLVIGGAALASALPLREEAGTRTAGTGIVVPASSGSSEGSDSTATADPPASDTGAPEPDASGVPQEATPTGPPSPSGSPPSGPQPVRPGPPIELDR